jgi:hypothetical protein
MGELLVFVKLLLEQKNILIWFRFKCKTDYFDISKVSTNNLPYDFLIIDKSTIQSKIKLLKRQKNHKHNYIY